MVKGAKEAKVLSVQEKEKKKAPPLALNTVELLRVASSGLGIGPQQTMQIAEKLYTQVFFNFSISVLIGKVVFGVFLACSDKENCKYIKKVLICFKMFNVVFLEAFFSLTSFVCINIQKNILIFFKYSICFTLTIKIIKI